MVFILSRLKYNCKLCTYRIFHNMALNRDEMLNLLEGMKRDLMSHTEGVIKREISGLKINELFQEQARQIKQLQEENKSLKESMESLRDKIYDFKRENNLVFFGIAEEADENPDKIFRKILDLVNHTILIECRETDLNIVRRIGSKGSKKRPTIVSFVSNCTKMRVLNNSKKLKGTGIFVAEDCDPKTRAKRSELNKIRIKLKNSGREVRMRKNGLIVDGKFLEYQDLLREYGIEAGIEEDNNEGERRKKGNARPGTDASAPTSSIQYFFRPRGGTNLSST